MKTDSGTAPQGMIQNSALYLLLASYLVLGVSYQTPAIANSEQVHADAKYQTAFNSATVTASSQSYTEPYETKGKSKNIDRTSVAVNISIGTVTDRTPDKLDEGYLIERA